MSKAFVDNTGIFNDQLPCLSATKRRDLDIVEYAGVVNKLRTGFRYCSQSEQRFRCLVLVPGLRSEVSAQIHLTLLPGMDQDPGSYICELVDKYKYYQSIRF